MKPDLGAPAQTPATAAAELVRGAGASGDLTAVARGGLANLLGGVLSAGASFAITLIIARSVSPSIAGRFFAVTSLFLMLETLGRLGADTGLVYFIARWRVTGQDERVRLGIRVAFVPIVAVCSSIGLTLVIFAPQLARLIGVQDESAVGLIRLLGGLLPLATAYDVVLGATRGFGWMFPTVALERIGRAALQLGFVAFVLIIGWHGALGAAWASPYILAFCIALLMLRIALRTRLREAPAGNASVRDIAGEFWRFCLPRAVAGVAQVLLQRLDIVLVASIRGVQDAAIYTVATRFLVVGQFLNQAITAPVQPRMSAEFAAGRTDRVRELYQASTAWLVLASWPLFGLTAVFAAQYVGLFGSSFHRGTATVVILSAAMLVASGVGLVDTVIIMAGKTSWNLGSTLLALIINVAVDLALIPSLGLLGAAIGWMCSILVSNLVPLLLAAGRLGLHPWGRSTIAAYVVCATCFVAIPLSSHAVFGGRLAADLVGAALGGVIYCWCVWRMRSRFALAGTLRPSAARKILA